MIKKRKNGSSQLRLDIGCGPHKKQGFLGVDIKKIKGVDYVVNLDKERLPFQDNSVSEIYCSHFMEHVDNPTKVLEEFNRVLKNKGILTVIVPHYSNPYAYHFTHKSYWSSYSLNQEYLDYYLNSDLELIDRRVKIVLIPFFDIILNFISNSSLPMYERFVCKFFHAWEVKFVLKKNLNRSERFSI